MPSVPTYDAIKFPSHIKTILVTGAGGFVGQKLTQLLLKYAPDVRLLTTDVIQPPTFGVSDEKKLKAVKADLGDVGAVKALLEGETVSLVYALHGIMSGGSEANFELGYAVNVDSHLNLLRATHKHAQETGQTGDKKPVYVFVSSLAIYGGPGCGPLDYVDPRKQPLHPGTSYGVEKNIMELYVYDYGRKGYLDTRNVRLPTVCIRAGAPSTAASSFVSGLIREPLQGIRTTLPLASSADDKTFDNYPLYCTKVTTVLRNIAYAGIMPESKFTPGEGRSINLPGVKVYPSQMLTALKKYGGEEAFKLVDYKIDPAVQAICQTWAGDYDSSISQGMGFEVDSQENGYNEAVEEFMAEMKEGK